MAETSSEILQKKIAVISNRQIHQKNNLWHLENEISGTILRDSPPPQIHDIILAGCISLSRAQRDGS